MDRQECVQVIRNDCLAKNGFLIRLRGGDLLISGYDNLKAALINYKGIIGNEEYRKILQSSPKLAGADHQ